LKTPKGKSTPTSGAHLQRLARERADEQARRIPWRRLLDVRNQYIEWQEFYLWVRSILEVEESIPDWLAEILDHRCPGFLQPRTELTTSPAKNPPLPYHLEDWIGEHVFGFAKKEGWFNAIAYYAIRDPQYQRAEVCWSECAEKWKRAKPIRYPTFEEWRGMALQCDDTAHLVPSERQARATYKLVEPDRLAAAVSSYMDWEAHACWARPALERAFPLPAEVTHELRRRCPGFLAELATMRERGSHGGSESRHQLMCWIADEFFQEAKAEGWFDAILIEVRSHPRAVRILEYADHCDEVWGSQLPDPYPSFEDWRTYADSYVEVRPD
jgi:hypothetical protein